jgi:hypothetical protein
MPSTRTSGRQLRPGAPKEDLSPGQSLLIEKRGRKRFQFLLNLRHLRNLRFSAAHFTLSGMLSECELNSGAYMHWISATPVW